MTNCLIISITLLSPLNIFFLLDCKRGRKLGKKKLLKKKLIDAEKIMLVFKEMIKRENKKWNEKYKSKRENSLNWNYYNKMTRKKKTIDYASI